MGDPVAREVLDYLAGRGFTRAAEALVDDLRDRDCPHAAAVFHPASNAGDDRGGGRSSGSSSSSDAFFSTGSSPSALLNPYGAWSTHHSRSGNSSVRCSKFVAAQEFHDPNIFSDAHWYNDHLGEYRDDFCFITENADRCYSEDKFVSSIGASEGDEPYNDMVRTSSPICNCCSGLRKHSNREHESVSENSCSAVYGRYQVMTDKAERLDECGEDKCKLRRSYEQPDATVLTANAQGDQYQGEKRNNLDMQPEEKKLHLLNPFNVNGDTFAGRYTFSGQKSSGGSDYCLKESFQGKANHKELSEKVDNTLYSEKASKTGSGDNSEIGNCEAVVEPSGHPKSTIDDADCERTSDESQLYDSKGEEYEAFYLRIIHRKNRTGFEGTKDFPIVLNSIIAGRYYVVEYIGSAAFSKVVQAHDLLMGFDVCLKIIKNDKEYFDQSLDEIKLLKFVNKYDPADDHHILRLYDYFYHQEHLFIVCELLKANLYEFQKYNQDSCRDVYFTLPRIQLIARQCLEALDYLHHLGIIHCDLKPENILMKSYSNCEIKVIDLGSSCFQSDNLCLYVQSRSYRSPEVILGLPYDQKIDIWSLGCILAELYSGDVLFPNDSLVMILARMIGILGPIDVEMHSAGQEIHKYFTEAYDLFRCNEETNEIEYLAPEKSSLDQLLQDADAVFIDFLKFLLQINPKERPTAKQALQHQWLSFLYA